MIKYILINEGIIDREAGFNIPICKGNRHYQEYLKWLEVGNNPIPKRPSEFHELVEDAWVLSEEKQWKSIRKKRDKLLKLSDYTMLIDVPLFIRQATNLWKKYRQKLRDIPQNFINPTEVVWPEKPIEPCNGEIV